MGTSPYNLQLLSLAEDLTEMMQTLGIDISDEIEVNAFIAGCKINKKLVDMITGEISDSVEEEE